jgi:hypothetical protein
LIIVSQNKISRCTGTIKNSGSKPLQISGPAGYFFALNTYGAIILQKKCFCQLRKGSKIFIVEVSCCWSLERRSINSSLNLGSVPQTKKKQKHEHENKREQEGEK